MSKSNPTLFPYTTLFRSGGSGSIYNSTTGVNLYGIEHLTFIGGCNNDSLSTDAGNEIVMGNAGDLVLRCGGKNGYLDGGTDKDSINSGTRDNTVFCVLGK